MASVTTTLGMLHFLITFEERHVIKGSQTSILKRAMQSIGIMWSVLMRTDNARQQDSVTEGEPSVQSSTVLSMPTGGNGLWLGTP